jgi:hypothetical protein
MPDEIGTMCTFFFLPEGLPFADCSLVHEVPGEIFFRTRDWLPAMFAALQKSWTISVRPLPSQ